MIKFVDAYHDRGERGGDQDIQQLSIARAEAILLKVNINNLIEYLNSSSAQSVMNFYSEGNSPIQSAIDDAVELLLVMLANRDKACDIVRVLLDASAENHISSTKQGNDHIAGNSILRYLFGQYIDETDFNEQRSEIELKEKLASLFGLNFAEIRNLASGGFWERHKNSRPVTRKYYHPNQE